VDLIKNQQLLSLCGCHSRSHQNRSAYESKWRLC